MRLEERVVQASERYAVDEALNAEVCNLLVLRYWCSRIINVVSIVSLFCLKAAFRMTVRKVPSL